jgi:hypothetical protein
MSRTRQNADGNQIVELTNSVTISTNGTTNIPIGISSYNSTTDTLHVIYMNGLQDSTNYSLNTNSTSIDLIGWTVNIGDTVYFQVLKNITNLVSPALTSGSLLTDSSVTNLKLATDAKVGSLATLTTTNKTDAVSAINENKVLLNTSIGTLANLATSVKTDVVSSINEVQQMSMDTLFRQALINSNFDVWQRGISFNGNGVWTADRWLIDNGSSTATRQTTGVPLGSKYCARATMNATGYINFSQALESDIVQKLIGKTVTFSIKIRRNSILTTDMFLQIQKTVNTDSMFGGGWTNMTSTTITNATIPTGTTSIDWLLVSATTTIPTDGSANGIRVFVNQPQTQPVNAYYEIAQATLNVGPIPLAFQPKSYADELLACMRYCEVWLRGSKDYSIPITEITSTTSATINIEFKVPKRATPILVVSGVTTNFRIIAYGATAGGTVTVNTNITAISLFSTGTDIYRGAIQITPGSAFAGTFYYPTIDTLGGATDVWFDAEL